MVGGSKITGRMQCQAQSPRICGSFAENDLQLAASHESSRPCVTHTHTISISAIYAYTSLFPSLFLDLQDYYEAPPNHPQAGYTAPPRVYDGPQVHQNVSKKTSRRKKNLHTDVHTRPIFTAPPLICRFYLVVLQISHELWGFFAGNDLYRWRADECMMDLRYDKMCQTRPVYVKRDLQRERTNERGLFCRKWPLKMRFPTGWRRCTGCLRLQISFRKRATHCRAILWKMTSKDKASCHSTPPSMPMGLCHPAARAHTCAHARTHTHTLTRRDSVISVNISNKHIQGGEDP